MPLRKVKESEFFIFFFQGRKLTCKFLGEFSLVSCQEKGFYFPFFFQQVFRGGFSLYLCVYQFGAIFQAMLCQSGDTIGFFVNMAG